MKKFYYSAITYYNGSEHVGDLGEYRYTEEEPKDQVIVLKNSSIKAHEDWFPTPEAAVTYIKLVTGKDI